MNFCRRRAPHATASQRRSGHTLVELLLSMGVTAILMVGLVSALSVATRTLDTSGSPAIATATARDAADLITADLRLAIAMSERTARATTISVPDRNGDGQRESIRYAWSGTSGAPLTRQYNGGAVVEVAQDVRQFDLEYLFKTMGPPPTVESPEQLLCSYTVAPNNELNLKNTEWAAEAFKPALPANALSWKITRAELMLRKTGSSSNPMSIELRAADGSNKPTGLPLRSSSLDSGAIPSSATWINASFTPLGDLPPGSAMTLVVTTAANGTVALVQYKDAISPASTDMFWTTTDNAGASWKSPAGNKSMIFKIYGTITTPGVE